MALVVVDRARERPDEVALRDERSALGWARLNELINRAANALASTRPRPSWLTSAVSSRGSPRCRSTST